MKVLQHSTLSVTRDIPVYCRLRGHVVPTPDLLAEERSQPVLTTLICFARWIELRSPAREAKANGLKTEAPQWLLNKNKTSGKTSSEAQSL